MYQHIQKKILRFGLEREKKIEKLKQQRMPSETAEAADCKSLDSPS